MPVPLHIANYVFFFFQAEDGIRDLVRSRGLGDVYKRQPRRCSSATAASPVCGRSWQFRAPDCAHRTLGCNNCLLYTSDAADERSSVDLGGRRIIKKKKRTTTNDNYQAKHA